MDITVVFFREMRWACTENCNRKWFEETFMCALSEQRVCLYLKGSGSVVIDYVSFFVTNTRKPRARFVVHLQRRVLRACVLGLLTELGILFDFLFLYSFCLLLI